MKTFNVTFPGSGPIQVQVPLDIVVQGRDAVQRYICDKLGDSYAVSMGHAAGGRAATNWSMSHDGVINHYIEEIEDIEEGELEELSPEADMKTDLEKFLDQYGGDYRYVVYYQNPK